MRLARVLRTSSPEPTLAIALERDGSLYDVAELELRAAGERATEAIAANFFARVFALGCAGLDALDDDLCVGERPTEARLFPGDFLWLPPCLPERSLWVQVESEALPSYRFGNARALLGHQASVAFPPNEESPDVDVSIAALLGEELYRATAEEAERAIVGYAILLGFVASKLEASCGATRARDFGATLGPVLVTKEEAGLLASARVRLRVGQAVMDLEPPGVSFTSLPESIAFISEHVALSPGDVISSVPLAGAREAARHLGLSFNGKLEVAIERLGKVEARPVRGPEPPPYRRAKSL